MSNSNCITTYSNKSFNPIQPNTEDIDLIDIAHSLSLMCRANGHFPVFYSVAQHCIYCCEEALARGYNKSVALACLLHDASEAYISDITRPIKPHLTNYLAIEAHLQSLIYTKYLPRPLSEEESLLVDLLDNLLLHHEFINFKQHHIPVNDIDLYSAPKFEFIDFKVIEDRYHDLFKQLTS